MEKAQEKCQQQNPVSSQFLVPLQPQIPRRLRREPVPVIVPIAMNHGIQDGCPWG